MRVTQTGAGRVRLSLAAVLITLAATASAVDSASQERGCAVAQSSVAAHFAAAGNHCPVAAAGLDRTASLGEAVELDASHSSDVDGDRLSYRWDLIERPAGSQAEIAASTALRTEFKTDLHGDYVVRLIVNDGNADSIAAEQRISTANTRPVAAAGSARSVSVGELVWLEGGGSFDLDGDSLDYRWELIERPADSLATLSTLRGTSPALTIDAAGDYVAQLTVSDGVSGSHTNTVRISTVNSRPQAHVLPGRLVAPGSTVQLDGSRSQDADEDALAYRWALLSAPAGEKAEIAAADTMHTSAKVGAEGLYVFQLIVADGSLFSEPVTMVVEARRSTLGDVKIEDHLEYFRQGGVDSDGDGISDLLDNCLTQANPGQQDTDNDGLGNRCDPDFNNDGIIDFLDLGFLKARFFSSDPDADLNSDGTVDFLDLGIIKQLFFRPPGPPGGIIWISLVDGDWDDRLNWDPQVVPTAGTQALVNVVPDVLVTKSGGSAEVGALIANNRVLLSGGATFTATGAIDLGNVLTITGATLKDTLVLQGTTGGTGTVVTNGSSTWDNAAFRVDGSIANGINVTVRNNLEVGATLTIDAPSSPTGLLLNGDQTISGNGTIVLDGVGNSVIAEPRLLTLTGGTVTTFGPALTIRGGKGTVGNSSGGVSMDFQGTLIADINAEPLVIGTGSAWTNSGTLRALNGGEVQLRGPMNNGGGSFVLDTAGGTAVLLSSGQLLDTTVAGTSGTLVTMAGFNTLDKVIFNGDMTVPNGSNTTVTGGLTLNGTATIDAPTSPTGFVFNGDQTLAGTGTVVFDGVGNSQISEPRMLVNTGALTVGPDITIRGGKGTVGNSSGGVSMDFQGTLIADINAEPLVIGTGSAWTNSGTLRALNGGEVQLRGPMNNGGGSFVLDTAGGTAVLLSSGQLLDTTVAGTSGTLVTLAGFNTFDNVIFNGDMTMPNGSNTTVTGGLTLNGTATIVAPTNATGFIFNGAQTLGGNATFVFDSAGNSVIAEPRLLVNVGSLVIEPTVTIRGATGTVGNLSGGVSMDFRGTLIADVAAEPIALGTGSAWTNSGTVRALNGGEVQLRGPTNNAGGSFVLDTAAGNAVLLSSAQLLSTTVAGTAGTNLTLAGSNTFDDLVFNGDLTLPNGSNTTVTGGLTLNGTATIVAPTSATGFIFNGAQTLAGNATFVFDSAGNSVNSEPRMLVNTGSLVIEPTVTIRGATGTVGNASGGVSMDFQGTLIAEVDTEDIVIGTGSAWTNSGTLRALNGGVVQLRGPLNNSGGSFVLDTAAGNSIALSSAQLLNTTVAGSSGTNLTLAAANTLDNVVFNGDLTIPNGSSTTVTNGLTLNGTATIVAPTSPTGFLFNGTQMLGGNATVVFDSAGNSVITEPRMLPIAGTLTIGAGVTIRGSKGTVGSVSLPLVNNGTISADVAGQTINVSGNGVTNGGTIAAEAGTIVNISNLTPAGGTLRAGAGGVLNVANTVTLGATDSVEIDTDGSANYGALSFGNVTLDGALTINAVNGFVPTAGQMATIITHGNSSSGSFATVMGNGGSFTPTYLVDRVDVTVN